MRGFVIVIVLLVLSVCAVLLLRLLHTEHVESAALARRAAFVDADTRARACVLELDTTKLAAGETHTRAALGCRVRWTKIERPQLGPLVVVEATATSADGGEVRLRQLRPASGQPGPVVRVSR